MEIKYGVENLTIFNFKNLILHEIIPPAMGGLISLDAIKKVNGFDDKLKIEDWYLWLKLTEKGEEMAIYPEVVALYRQHDTNTFRNIELMHKGRQEVLARFKESKHYQQALRDIFFIYAVEVFQVSRLKSSKALIYSRKVNRQAVKLIIQLLIPNFVLNSIKKIKNK